MQSGILLPCVDVSRLSPILEASMVIYEG